MKKKKERKKTKNRELFFSIPYHVTRIEILINIATDIETRARNLFRKKFRNDSRLHKRIVRWRNEAISSCFHGVTVSARARARPHREIQRQRFTRTFMVLHADTFTFRLFLMTRYSHRNRSKSNGTAIADTFPLVYFFLAFLHLDRSINLSA